MAIREHPPCSIPESVEGASHSYADLLDAAAESHFIDDFAHEAQVIRLHRELHEPHSGAIRSLEERLANEGMSAAFPQTLETRFEPQCDMHTMPRRDHGSLDLRCASLPTLRLAARARSRSAPGRELERRLPGAHLRSLQ